MQRITVIIADDEPAIREALAEMIAAEPSLELLGVAGDPDEAIYLARTRHPDVAVLDAKMPAGGGAKAARGIRACAPGTRILAFSAHDDRGSVHDMATAGAEDYLTKGVLGDEIVATIHRIVQGRGAFSAQFAAPAVPDPAE